VPVLFFGLGWLTAWLYRQGPVTRRLEWIVLYVVVLNALSYTTDLLTSLNFGLQQFLPICALVMLILFAPTVSK